MRTPAWARSPLVPVGVLVALLVVSALAVAGYVRSYTELSPVDELQHLDYVDRALDFGIVRAGDVVGERAMREQACRGVDSEFRDHNPDCDAERLDPATFQESGYNTAYIHPPTYYYVTASIARAVDATPNVESRVTAARLVGVLWLGLAVVATWYLLGALAVTWPLRVPLLLVMVFVPVTLHASATVNPDTTALAAGAVVLLAVVRWEQGRLHWLWPALAAGAAVALKSTNGIAVVVALGYLGVRHLQARRGREEAPEADVGVDADDPAPGTDALAVATRARARPGGREALRLVLAVVVAVAIVSVTWVAWARAIQVADPSTTIPMSIRHSVDSIDLDDLRANLTTAFTPIKGDITPGYTATDRHLPPFLADSSTVRTLDAWANVLVGAGAIVGAVYAGAGSRRRAVAVAAIGACLLAGPFFVLANFVLAGTYVDIPPRYALSALPALLVGCSVVLERRAFLVGAYAFSGWLAFSILLPTVSG